MRLAVILGALLSLLAIMSCGDSRVAPTSTAPGKPSLMTVDDCDPPGIWPCELHPFETNHYLRADEAINRIGEYVVNPDEQAMCGNLQNIARTNLGNGSMRYWSGMANPDRDGDYHFNSQETHFREFYEGNPGLQAHEAYHKWAGPTSSQAQAEAQEVMASYYQEVCGG